MAAATPRRLLTLAVGAAMFATACGGAEPAATTDTSPPVTAAPATPAATPQPSPSATSEPTDAPPSEPAASDPAPSEPTEPSTTESPSSAPPPPPPSSDAPASPTPTPQPARDPVTHPVDVFDFGFQPAQLTVAVGDTVTWTNTGDVNHTVTFSSGPDSGSMGREDTFSHTFDESGSFNYRCLFHSQMQGTIDVG